MKNEILSLKTDLSKMVKLLEKESVDTLKSTMQNVKDKCDIEHVDDMVKKNPKESLAIAFTAGAVLALLLGGRR
jgi:ElaB/YqjD/DUF883 family membrane-anchored ribosome-binding protein